MFFTESPWEAEELEKIREEAGIELPDIPPEEEIPEITEVDKLQTFVGSKKNKVWIWTVVNHWRPGILLWTVSDRAL